MGSTVSTIFTPKVAILSLDEGDRDGFSRQVFPQYEWEVLKFFCNKHKIRQADLVLVFKLYLSHEEAHLRSFQVRTLDVKKPFLQHSRLMQVLIPKYCLTMFFHIDYYNFSHC